MHPDLLDLPDCGPAPRATGRWDWTHHALALLGAHAPATTPLHRVVLPGWPTGIDLFMLDESTHLTGALKHRLAHALLVDGVVSGRIGPRTQLFDASSGSTAISEAHFARLLGLRLTAVMPRSTSPDKIAAVIDAGAKAHLVDHAADMEPVAAQLATSAGGYYLDQFGRAAAVTDWRRHPVAESIDSGLRQTPTPVPDWIVVGAGTGGTSAGIGRWLRHHRRRTQLMVADPESSVYAADWRGHTPESTSGSRIEGIGRPHTAASWTPGVVDHVTTVPDVLSVAAMRWLAETTDHCAGPSTGTNLAACLALATDLARHGATGTIVTLIADDGQRYRNTYYNDDWCREHGIDPAEAKEKFGRLVVPR